jgi:Mg/Co/Ni transporter MgtE
MTDDRAADILESMPADEAADILSELDEERSRELLSMMEHEDADEVRELLEYDKKTAGRLMTTDVLSFRADLTAAEAIEELRRQQPESDSAYYLYVVDAEDRLQGVVSLRDLVVSPPGDRLDAMMDPHVVFVNEDDPQEDVAEVMTKYDLMAVPVVDEAGKLVGMDLIHDVVDDVYLERDRRKRGSRHS